MGHSSMPGGAVVRKNRQPPGILGGGVNQRSLANDSYVYCRQSEPGQKYGQPHEPYPAVDR